MLTLKNRSLPWSVRLEKAKELWHSNDYLPKKEQALLDWLAFALHSSDEKS